MALSTSPAAKRAGGRGIPRWASLGIPMILTSGILARHLDFVPIWDARKYFDTMAAAARAPFNPLNFNVFSHPSMLFFLWTALGQFLDPGNAVLLNLSQIVLALVAVASFWSVAGRLLASPRSEPERLLLTSVFAVCPVFLASVQNVNPDTGVCVFLLAYLALLFAHRYAAATAAGLFLVFSKESGVLLYPIATLLYLGVAGSAKPIRERARDALRNTYAFLPLIAYGAMIGATRLTARTTVWTDPTGAGKKEGLLRLFLIPWASPVVQNAYVGGVCVLNFGWISTGFIVAALIASLVRTFRHRPILPATVDRRAALFLAALLFVTAYVLTRFPTFTNVRYLLPVFPIEILVFGLALRLLLARRGLRTALLGLVAVLSFVSVFRTVDPVSKALYGTFTFGRHDLLAMTSVTGECCGFGRDQLEYDLEYVHFATIQDRIYAAIRPTPRTFIVKNFFADWYLDGTLDAATFHRTLRTTDVVLPAFRTTDRILAMKDKPPEIFFVAFPNVDNRPDFAWLTRTYRIAAIHTFGESGYEIPVFRMERR